MLTRSFAVAMALCVAARMQAQAGDSATKAVQAAPPARKTVVTVSPFSLFTGFATVDAERAVSPSVSLGASASAGFSDEDEFYSDGFGSFDGIVRYYPSEKVLRGFSIATALGVATSRGANYTSLGIVNPNGTTTVILEEQLNDRVTRATVGMDASYQWLLGPKQKFVIVLGAGLKRIIGRPAYVGPLANAVLPAGRLNIGFAF